MDYLRLDVEKVPINELIEAIQAQLLAHGILKSVRFKVETQYQQLFCDLVRIKKVLVDTITALRATEENKPIIVSLSDTT